MSNLRIVSANYADQSSSLVASSTAGSLAAALMLTDEKIEAHRSVGTAVTYTLKWSNSVSVGALHLPATNLSSSAAVRVRLYSDVNLTTVIADSGVIAACPGAAEKPWAWTGAFNANAFAYGILSKVSVWFPANVSNVRGCFIEVDDPSVSAGYIDNARIVLGPYWEPAVNADYGAVYQLVDDTKNSRADSGSLYSDRGPVSEYLSLKLSFLALAERTAILNIIRSNGVWKPIFVSLFPDDLTNLGQTYQIYGKRKNASIDHPFFNTFAAPLELEGW